MTWSGGVEWRGGTVFGLLAGSPGARASSDEVGGLDEKLDLTSFHWVVDYGFLVFSAIGGIWRLWWVVLRCAGCMSVDSGTVPASGQDRRGSEGVCCYELLSSEKRRKCCWKATFFFFFFFGKTRLPQKRTSGGS